MRCRLCGGESPRPTEHYCFEQCILCGQKAGKHDCPGPGIPTPPSPVTTEQADAYYRKLTDPCERSGHRPGRWRPLASTKQQGRECVECGLILEIRKLPEAS